MNHRAWDLAALLLCSFDSFRDVAEHRSRPVFFAKRAQITALDLSMAWTEHDYDPLVGLDQLTAFADYRLPQALRHLGIVEVVEDLGRKIDGGNEIAAGSPEEVELRAATVVAVDEMQRALTGAGSGFRRGRSTGICGIDRTDRIFRLDIIERGRSITERPAGSMMLPKQRTRNGARSAQEG